MPKAQDSRVGKNQEVEPDIGVDDDIHESIKMSAFPWFFLKRSLMIIVVSPAKTLDFSPISRAKLKTLAPSLPHFTEEAKILVDVLRNYPSEHLQDLMSISEDLGALNHQRFQAWEASFPAANSKPAVLAFDGDVYDGLNAKTLAIGQLRWANEHLRILSGLYGILRPLDWLQPYRLEMGTALPNVRGKNLYHYWGTQLALQLRQQLEAQKLAKKSKVLVNLASEEYFKAVDLKALGFPVLSPVFLDTAANGSGSFKVISFFAKRARGLMARYIIDHKLKNPEDLKHFAESGYVFDPRQSRGLSWVFKRSNGSHALRSDF